MRKVKGGQFSLREFCQLVTHSPPVTLDIDGSVLSRVHYCTLHTQITELFFWVLVFIGQISSYSGIIALSTNNSR